MKVPTLMLLIFIILVILYVFTKFYRKKELICGKLEGEYFIAVKKYKKDPTDQNKESAEKSGVLFAKAKGIKESRVSKMISNDLLG